MAGKLYIVSGDDDFAQKARSRALAASLAEGDPESCAALEVISGDGDGMKFAEIAEAMLGSMRTPPFLTPNQIIWLRNFAFMNELADAYKGKGAAAELAAALCEALPDEQTVLINGPGFDQRKSFAKALKAAGAEIFIESGAAKPNDRNYADNRRRAIADFCRNAGKSIAPAAVQYLETIIGSDTGTMMNELEKLLLYAGDAPEITLADCRAVSSRTPEAVSWTFTGALIERDLRTALEVLDTLIKQGDAALRVLAAVGGEFQKLIQVKRAMRELKLERVNPRTFDGISDAEKAANPGNMLLKLHPYRAFKMCESALKYPDAEVAKSLDAVLNANRALVSGGGEPRIVLEQLVFKICTP